MSSKTIISLICIFVIALIIKIILNIIFSKIENKYRKKYGNIYVDKRKVFIKDIINILFYTAIALMFTPYLLQPIHIFWKCVFIISLILGDLTIIIPKIAKFKNRRLKPKVNLINILIGLITACIIIIIMLVSGILSA